MRVAHFVQRYPPALGGSEAYLARLSRYLAARGHEVTVFTTTALDLDAFWATRGKCLPPGTSFQDGVTVRRYALWRLPWHTRCLKALSLVPHRPWQCWTLSCNPIAWGMWRDSFDTSQPFDVVHATAFPYGWPLACARRLARTLQAPFFLTPFLHFGDPENARDRIRAAYTHPALLALARDATRLFVQTEGERRLLLERGFPAQRVILQGMGLDVASCTGGDRDAARAAWAAGKDEVVIGHLANQSREKGSIDLLRAAQLISNQGIRFRVVLAGPEMPNFQGFWKTYATQNRVLKLGVLDAQQKKDFFAGIDLFALPSRSDSFGLVLLEAWANGAPSVAYRAGGVAWVIRDEVDGLLVRCGDVGGLAVALVRLIQDAQLRRRLGGAGQARTHTEFQWEDKLAIVERAYLEAAANSK